MLACPQPIDVTDWTAVSEVRDGFTGVQSLGSEHGTASITDTSGATVTTWSANETLISIAGPTTTLTTVLSYSVSENSISSTIQTTGSTSTTGSTRINPYEINLGTNTSVGDIGPVFFANTTIEITDHLAGPVTTTTTSSRTVISGTATWDSAASQTAPTSTTVTQSYQTFTTKTDTEFSTTTTFDGTNYTTTTRSAGIGFTFTRASYWCSPFLEYGKIKTLQTVYVPEFNVIKEDWVWLFNPPISNIEDWTGATYQFTDLYESTDAEFTINEDTPLTVINYNTYDRSITSDTQEFDQVIVTASTYEASFLSFTSDSFASIRFSDDEIPTPSYEEDITFSDTQTTTEEGTSKGTAVTSGVAASGFDITTYMVGADTITATYTALVTYRNSDSGAETLTTEFFTHFYTETTEQTEIKYAILTDTGFPAGGLTNTMLEQDINPIGYQIVTLNVVHSEFTPTYLEGFQIQPYIDTSDAVYQAAIASATCSNTFNQVCLGFEVNCPYNDDLLNAATTDDQIVIWDDSGNPYFTVFPSTGDFSSAEVFGVGIVNTVRSRYAPSINANSGWRIGGHPRAGGKFTYYLKGGVMYTQVIDGVSASSTYSADGATVEADTNAHAGFLRFAIYQIYMQTVPGNFSYTVLDKHIQNVISL